MLFLFGIIIRAGCLASVNETNALYCCAQKRVKSFLRRIDQPQSVVVKPSKEIRH